MANFTLANKCGELHMVKGAGGEKQHILFECTLSNLTDIKVTWMCFFFMINAKNYVYKLLHKSNCSSTAFMKQLNKVFIPFCGVTVKLK